MLEARSGPTASDDAARVRAALDLAALVALEEPARDGRVARGQRTRRNVAEALMDLLRAGDPDPTAKAVARRADVSLRLVFHHFADMDDLYKFVAALLLRRQWADMPQLSPRLSLATRIERTVAHRAALFEETSEIRRALVCRAPTAPAIRQALAAADDLFLQDLQATFAAELAALPASSPRRVPRGHGHRHVLGGLGASAHHVGHARARGQEGDGPHAREALRRHRPDGWRPRRQPSARCRSQSSGASARRRRTSATVGAGYPSMPGRQPSSIFCAPGPSSVQTWQVFVKKEKPPSRIGCSPLARSRPPRRPTR